MNYVITHHVITTLHLTADPLTRQRNVNSCMSHRPTHMRFPSRCRQHTQRMHGLRRNQKTEICNARTRKTQLTQPILSLHFSCACVAFFLSASHDQHALYTAAWKPTFIVSFRRPYIRFPSCPTQHAMQRTHGLQRNQNQNTRGMHAKNTTHTISFILCMRCVFYVHALRFFCLCRTTSVRCICCIVYGSLETDL